MGSNTGHIRRGENGFVFPIKIIQNGADRGLSSFVAADTTVTFKEVPNGPVILTLTDLDFDFNSPSIDWTVTDVHISTLSKSEYFGYAHLRNNANELEEIAAFHILITEV